MSAHLYRMIKKAYAIIGDATPVDADCGRLCDAACCKGDEDVGMLLFPGEAVRLAGVAGFRVSRIPYMDGKSWFLTCEGSCDRELRPLACRIFPLAPRVDLQGRVAALPDPRARALCPLADGKYLNRRYVKSVDRAFAYLAEDPHMLAFMRRLSSELDELRAFF